MIEIIRADITKLEVDAIVNAANQSLLGGGGVDGAIHKAAGKLLLKECKEIGACPTGEARITGGYNLPAKHIIHTVGPVYKNGKRGEPAFLKSAYLSSLSLASEYNIESLAFPNISTGVYGYPLRDAAIIAIKTVKDYMKENQLPAKVYFVCFNKANYHIYNDLIKHEALQ
jgi:O-acetyl-ADP-ribose deacetylase